MAPSDVEDWLALEAVPGLGPGAARSLLTAFPGPGAILGASLVQLQPLVGESLARALQVPPPEARLAPTLQWLSEPDAHFIPCTDPLFPPLLNELPGAPAWLYVRGDPAMLHGSLLAIVGSRNATPQGRRDAQAFARSLGEAGLTIVSGLAEGIDAAAHEGGLEGNGRGVAVVGTGLDRVYPAKHRSLAHRLAQGGALVSEFPIGTPPRPGHFPRRNRLISGLSLGVLVVEAAPQSGSLITARLAADQGREVFAIPGSIHSPLAKGCHQLIRQGAKLVESAQDVLEELAATWAPSGNTPGIMSATDMPEGDSEAARRLLDTLGSVPMTLDTLAERTGLTVEGLSAMLLTLELEGRVAPMPGGYYQRQY